MPDGLSEWRVVRATHVVIGGGVSANEAACGLLCARVGEGAGARYNALVFRCATHPTAR